jgi:hypothetical protein
VLPNRKNIFLKSWLWSLIGAGGLVAVFWFLTDIIHIFQRLNNLTIFTNIILGISVVGSILGTGLVTWRIADKYFHNRLAKIMKSYYWLSLLSFIVALVVIFLLSPLTPLIVIWNLVAPLCAVRAIRPPSEKRA